MFAKLNKIGELTKILSVKSETCDSIMHFMACFGIGRILSKHSLDKMRGRDMAEQILAMMVFRILGETIGFMSKTKFYDILEVGKNCFYRLLARPEMDWRILLLSMARRFQNIVRKEKAEEINAPKCYIIDDTTVSKTGLHFEGLSRVFDHVLSKCVLGYKLLILAFFDGRKAHTPWTCPYTGSPERRVTIACQRKNVPCSSTKSVLKATRTMNVSRSWIPRRVTT